MFGYYSNSRRVDYGEGVQSIDFEVEGKGIYVGITHVETKNPVGKTIRVNENMSPEMREAGRGMGKKGRWQKKYWSNPEKYSTLPNVNLEANFPESPQNVLIVLDLHDVPSSDFDLFDEGFNSGRQNDPNVFRSGIPQYD